MWIIWPVCRSVQFGVGMNLVTYHQSHYSDLLPRLCVFHTSRLENATCELLSISGTTKNTRRSLAHVDRMFLLLPCQKVERDKHSEECSSWCCFVPTKTRRDDYCDIFISTPGSRNTSWLTFGKVGWFLLPESDLTRFRRRPPLPAETREPQRRASSPSPHAVRDKPPPRLCHPMMGVWGLGLEPRDVLTGVFPGGVLLVWRFVSRFLSLSLLAGECHPCCRIKELYINLSAASSYREEFKGLSLPL